MNFGKGVMALTVSLTVVACFIASGCHATTDSMTQAGTANNQQIDVEAASMAKWGGKKAEPFTLSSADGKSVDLVNDLGKKPIVLVFYRGVW
jgi:cytochrome oxidase Cu insertion factor (SCO1/SenC/PrrC family)